MNERTPDRHQNFPETAFTSPKNAKAVVHDQRQRLARPGWSIARTPARIPTFLKRSAVWLTIVRHGVCMCADTRTLTYEHTRPFARSFSPFCLSPPLFLTGVLPCPSRFSTIYFTLQLLSSRAFPSLLWTILSISCLEKFLSPLSLSQNSHFFSILFVLQLPSSRIYCIFH